MNALRPAGAHAAVPGVRPDPPVGLLPRDVALTRDEVDGLTAGLLTSHAAPDGTTRLIERLSQNVEALGCRYVPEVRRP